MKEGKTLSEFVEGGIKNIFREIAKMDNNLTEDEAAGLPMFLFRAENYLLSAWWQYIEHGDSA